MAASGGLAVAASWHRKAGDARDARRSAISMVGMGLGSMQPTVDGRSAHLMHGMFTCRTPAKPQRNIAAYCVSVLCKCTL
jgi:hypothetical protein